MNRIPRLIAPLLVIAMLMSGCRQENTIISEPLDLSTDQLSSASGEADYVSPGYYAPNAVMNADQPIVPAPATAQEIREAAMQAAILDQDYQQASRYTTIAKGDINIGLVVGDQTTINPLRCSYMDVMNLNTLVYEGLVTLDENQMPVPQLADRWSVSGDTWTFTLRGGVSFQDGSLLTPEDVVASFDELKRNPGSYWYPLVSAIKSVTRVNESEVAVKGQSGYMMLYAMTFPIVQRNSMESDAPYGTGPYLVSRYDIGNAIRLDINPQWWKRGTEQVHSIVGLLFRTSQLAIEALERGDIDSIDTLVSEYPTVSINRNLSDRMTLDYSTLTYECIIPNLKNSILRDHAVREALMYAIDRTTLAGTVYTGMVQESEVPVVPGSWLYEPQAARYNYNPERARQILVEAGWSDPEQVGVLQREVDSSVVKLSLRLFTTDRGTTSTRSEAVEAIATQLRLVGFEINVEKMNKASDLRGAMNEGKFDLALCAFELSEIPNLAFLLASNGASNYERYNSGEMDKLLKTAYDARTADELQAAMSRLQLKIVDDLPILGLFFRTGVLISKKPMRGLNILRRGYVLCGIETATVDP